jgi:hypothetical protein
MKLVKLLAQASRIRRSRVKSGLDKAAKKPKKKGLSSSALKRQMAIRNAYGQQNYREGYLLGSGVTPKGKGAFAKLAKRSLQSYGSMVGDLYRKTPKTQFAIGTAGTAASFGAGGYFLNREDDKEE